MAIPRNLQHTRNENKMLEKLDTDTYVEIFKIKMFKDNKGREGKTQVEKRRVSLMYFIVDIRIFLLSE